MQEEYSKVLAQAKLLKTENTKFLNRLKQKPPKKLDVRVQEIHEEVFEEVDCLACANCCSTTSPILTDKDTARISRYLRMKIFDFEKKYTRMDAEGDRVFLNQPCEFLGADKHCFIYEVRPKACAEYPHTNRKRFHQLNKITAENTMICPAVNKVLDRLKNIY